MAGSIVVSGTQTGSSEGPRVFSYTITAGTVGANTELTLASGPNTITVPTTAVGCVITPPSANTQTLTLKGVTGDTGVPIHPTTPSLIVFPATPPATFVITAGALTTGITSVAFF